jgi:hemerythrin-like domain-containing protein
MKNKSRTVVPKKTAIKIKKPTSVTNLLGNQLGKLSEQVGNLFSNRPSDVVSAIKIDHQGLRNFLKILKNTDAEMSERRRAYDQFSSLLKSHSKVEEKVVYKTAVDLTGREMHLKVAEGFVEHQLADDLMARIERTTDSTEWSAHANVLSEIVEHHLKEEESDLLPLVRKAGNTKIQALMLENYLKLRRKTQSDVTSKNAGVLEPVANQ